MGGGDWYSELITVMMKPPAVWEAVVDVIVCIVPIWAAVMIGLLIGWSWRPRWTGLLFLGLRGRLNRLLLLLWAPATFSVLGAPRLWFAFTALSAFSLCRRLWSSSSFFSGKVNNNVGVSGDGVEEDSAADGGGATGSTLRRVVSLPLIDNAGISGTSDREQDLVTENDLQHLLQFLDGRVGDAAWQHMMERTTPNMTYQAWRLEPEEGPVVYRSKTIFEDASPELVRDFFWDDGFRLKWDAMLARFKVLEENPDNGMMTVHWIKKFPFFCGDREYIIGRRIWETGNTYYCVTKGVDSPSVPRRDKPRRVELYFSSWRIRAVESRKQDGQLSACEVTLIHYEDMGIPKDVAKVGVRHGMWGAVKRLQSGMRTYQLTRKSETLLSKSAIMARMTTKIPANGTISVSDNESSSRENKGQALDLQRSHPGIDWKWVVIGGVAVACGLQTGLIGKSLLFGAARRLARA